MTAFGYGQLKDRAFVAFERELNDGAWKDIDTSPFDAAAKDNAAALLSAPLTTILKIRLRMSIAQVLNALAAPALPALDEAWDASQRRLFHRIAVGANDENLATRNAADRLTAALLLGTGTGQTQMEFDAEVDFGRRQIALVQESSTLAADVKKLKLGDTLADIDKCTEALAQALGRSSGQKRKTPSKQLREALSDCASGFTSVHETLAWLIERTPKGAQKDGLENLLAPLEALLQRGEKAARAQEAEPEAPPPANPT